MFEKTTNDRSPHNEIYGVDEDKKFYSFTRAIKNSSTVIYHPTPKKKKIPKHARFLCLSLSRLIFHPKKFRKNLLF